METQKLTDENLQLLVRLTELMKDEDDTEIQKELAKRGEVLK